MSTNIENCKEKGIFITDDQFIGLSAKVAAQLVAKRAKEGYLNDYLTFVVPELSEFSCALARILFEREGDENDDD